MEHDEMAWDLPRQPARGEPIEVPRPPRPLLDWGDEEPDTFWEDLYYRGLVDPPFRGAKERAELAEIIRSWKPLGKPMTDEELMCALGRCRCERCE